jgi:cytochrome oxidase Cu insertion factor (SCO1/SenC/PrrC family)
MAFAVFQPVTVLPRYRPSPGYALTDSEGERFTSEDARGAITLYTFVPLECGDLCDRVDRTMTEVGQRVPAEVDLAGLPFEMATIVLDGDPELDAVAGAREAAGADGLADTEWRWLTGTDDQVANVVGHGFRRRASTDDFSPSYAIVDSTGTIRGEYRYQTLADDADKLVRHVDLLGSELRNSGGLTGLAFEAAHLFQCYP